MLQYVAFVFDNIIIETTAIPKFSILCNAAVADVPDDFQDDLLVLSRIDTVFTSWQSILRQVSCSTPKLADVWRVSDAVSGNWIWYSVYVYCDGAVLHANDAV